MAFSRRVYTYYRSCTTSTSLKTQGEVNVMASTVRFRWVATNALATVTISSLILTCISL